MADSPSMPNNDGLFRQQMSVSCRLNRRYFRQIIPNGGRFDGHFRKKIRHIEKYSKIRHIEKLSSEIASFMIEHNCLATRSAYSWPTFIQCLTNCKLQFSFCATRENAHNYQCGKVCDVSSAVHIRLLS